MACNSFTRASVLERRNVVSFSSACAVCTAAFSLSVWVQSSTLIIAAVQPLDGSASWSLAISSYFFTYVGKFYLFINVLPPLFWNLLLNDSCCSYDTRFTFTLFTAQYIIPSSARPYLYLFRMSHQNM